MPSENKLAFRPENAAQAADVGVTKIRTEIREGRLRARKSGKATLIEADDLKAWIKSLPPIQPALA